MKKLFTLLFLGVVCANFNIFADCLPPTNVQVIPVSNPIAGEGIIVVWTSGSYSVPDVTYDVHFDRVGFNNNDSIMGIHINQTSVLSYHQFYNGVYTITVCAHCPDGSVVCSTPITYIINNPEWPPLIICPDIDLGGTVSAVGNKEIALDCSIDSYVLKPNIPVKGGTIDHYDVEPIPYSPPLPFVGLNNVIFTQDNTFAENIVPFPFEFCFYENTYNQILIGPNGNINFNTSFAGQLCPNNYTYSDFPNTNIDAELKNSIFGVMEDIDRTIDTGTIQWAVLGQAGCRVFLISYNEIPLFNCNEKRNSYQIVLYEKTNIIEVYVQKRENCPTWMNGRGVIGVINSTGEKATVAPERNVTDTWTTVTDSVNTSEAWRFTPISENDNYTIKWYNGLGTSGAPFSTADSLIINCSENSRTVTAKIDVFPCNDGAFTYRDSVKVYWKNKPYIIEEATVCQGDPLTWRGRNIDVRFSGYYEFEDVVNQNNNCCDTIYHLKLTVNHTYQNFNAKDTIYDGEDYVFGGKIYTPSDYRPILNIIPSMLPYVFLNDTLSSIYGCDSVVYTKLTVLPSVINVETNDSINNITLLLDIPTNVPITIATFTVILPEGISIDEVNCALSAILANNYDLEIINNHDGTWTFNIMPATANSQLLRNTMLTTNYQDIVNIAYKISENLADGIYTALITDLHFTFADNTEINQDIFHIILKVGNSDTGIETLQATSLQIYPNPTKGIITIDGINAGETVTIIDLQGHTVLTANSATINVSGLPNGVYLVRVGNKIAKLIKQ
ncbi:MAG: T9SS type A sorting domain-containing protein [Prevotellaceae bacterium]|jgi:hypothetical protein|nr:T9SS type A sorting domain-containing protein [Prevotellaceae bacterium]